MTLTKSISDVVQGNPMTAGYQPVKAEVSVLLTELDAGQNSIGYKAGTGGTVTQITSKSTGVTLSFDTGRITTQSAALAAGATVRFTATNTGVLINDVPVLSIRSPASKYRVWVDSVAAGSFVVALENVTGGSLSEAVLINFALFKGATT
jgi:hypothetical protein